MAEPGWEARERIRARERTVLFATACGLVVGQLIRHRRRRQLIDPVVVAVGAGSSAYPARDIAAWLTREAGGTTRGGVYVAAAFATGLTLAYVAGASRGLARGASSRGTTPSVGRRDTSQT